MNYNLVVFLMLLLSGCGEYVYEDNYSEAEQLCKNNRGVHYVYKDSYRSIKKVVCINSAHFKLTGEL